MKIRVGNLKQIIREELSASASRGQSLNEAGDVSAWYQTKNKVPPALQKAAMERAGSFLFGFDRQIRAMHDRAKEVGSPVPAEVSALIPMIDEMLIAFSDAAEAVSASVKRIERKAAATGQSVEELEAQLAAAKAARGAGAPVAEPTKPGARAGSALAAASLRGLPADEEEF